MVRLTSYELVGTSLAVVFGVYMLCGMGCDDSAKEQANQLAQKAKATANHVAQEVGIASEKQVDSKSPEDAVQPEKPADEKESLTDQALVWLNEQAESTKSGVEATITRGQRTVSVIKELKRVLNEVVDSETVIEPIYQHIADDEAKARTDKAIGDMPRVEVINGLTVGFKDLTSSDTGKRITEKGYLVIWRHGDHRIGFVYRRRKEIDIEKLIQQVPKIIEAFNKALS